MRQSCSSRSRRRMRIWPVLLLGIMTAACRSAHPNQPPTWVASEPVINMYSQPTTNTDVVSQVVLGRMVTVLKKKGAWRRIRTDDAYEGWIQRKTLLKLEQQESPYARRSGYYEVQVLQGNVYREADVTGHAPLLVLPFGSRLEAVAVPVDEGWVQIRLPDNRRGWIQSGDVVRDPHPVSIDDMVALARRFMGITYLWGGVSSFGIDCSGFTQLLQRQRGIIMPRDADLQAAWVGMDVVEPAALQPGDLLFFGTSMERITHTGMVIGGGEFIHATTAGHPGVQVSRLDDPRWRQQLVCCRRVK